MSGSPARVWFVLAGVFAALAVGGWFGARVLPAGGTGLGLITLSSAALTLVCLGVGALAHLVARGRR